MPGVTLFPLKNRFSAKYGKTLPGWPVRSEYVWRPGVRGIEIPACASVGPLMNGPLGSLPSTTHRLTAESPPCVFHTALLSNAPEERAENSTNPLRVVP